MLFTLPKQKLKILLLEISLRKYYVKNHFNSTLFTMFGTYP